MKWKINEQSTERIIQTFAIFPIRINYEVVWFETVYIRQNMTSLLGWVNKEFVTKQEYNNFNNISYE